MGNVLYAIRRKSDGLFSNGKRWACFGRKVRVWVDTRSLRTHLSYHLNNLGKLGQEKSFEHGDVRRSVEYLGSIEVILIELKESKPIDIADLYPVKRKIRKK